MFQQWRPYDRIVLARNPLYWEAQSVVIGEIVFLSVSSVTTNVNLYKAGGSFDGFPSDSAAIGAGRFPERETFDRSRVQTYWYLMNIGKPPLDRPGVRYALNLATDKTAIATFLGAGQTPANGIVPPMAGYSTSATLPVSVNGRNLNVLAFYSTLGAGTAACRGDQ